jgi:two-component system, chemotaxis family, protein-glutamate methylesterase/glutaminase
MIPGLPEDFPVPVVLVQHMPPLFTRLLAQRLNARSPLAIAEGEARTRLEPGHVWIAPGNYHMTVARVGNEVILELNQNPRTIPAGRRWTFGAHALAVVMTGMGSDGTRGARSIREAGGEILVQDEATSVVWGMPGSIVRRAIGGPGAPAGPDCAGDFAAAPLLAFECGGPERIDTIVPTS